MGWETNDQFERIGFKTSTMLENDESTRNGGFICFNTQVPSR